MFMHKSKKGFTIVELVIVIAVIAILAAVLIPTFSNLVKKANQSADIQAARQMNTVLAAEGAVKAPNIFELYDALAANGMTAKDYKPLTTDHYFFWDDGANRIVYTDKNYQVLFPADFEKQGNWLSLTQEIAVTKPATYTEDGKNVTATVKSGAEMAYVLSRYENVTISPNESININITVDGDIDMMGADFKIPFGYFDVDKDYPITINIVGTNNAVIRNVSSVGAAVAGNGSDEGHLGVYNAGLIPEVPEGATALIKDIVFENINVRNPDIGNVALLIGGVVGEATISNVTINKSTVIGHRNTGALIGLVDKANTGVVKFEGEISLTDVHVKTVGGRSGMLIGLAEAADTRVTDNTTGTGITLTDCSYGIYDCEHNTGTFGGLKLGLDGDSIWSKKLGNDYKTYTREKYTYKANALVMITGSTAETSNGTIFSNVTGW